MPTSNHPPLFADLDFYRLREAAVEFMRRRGWNRLVGKSRSRGFEQSLLDHTLVELDMLLSVLPLIASSFSPVLSDEEAQILIASIVAHDVGKERVDWQEYVDGHRSFLSDVDPGLTERVLPELAETLGFEHRSESVSAVLLHMRHERTQGDVLHRVIFGEHSNKRWKALADVVDAVDNIASGNGLLAALHTLQRSYLGNHLRLSHHLIQLRGVSSTLLHRAAIDSFSELGWSPILHFPNGSIYATASDDRIEIPAVDAISRRLAHRVSEVLPSEMTNLVVGHPLRSMIPKGDLFDYRELPQYLAAAGRKAKRGNFLKKGAASILKTVNDYRRLKGLSDTASDGEIDRLSQRISSAHPEMCIFKFFKAALNTIPAGVNVSEDAAIRYRPLPNTNETNFTQIAPGDIARIEYDKTFGHEAFASLLSTSTLMPARDMAATIDWYWALEGYAVGLSSSRVEHVDDEQRERRLIEILSRIGQAVFESVPDEQRPKRVSPEVIATALIGDLVFPTALSDPRALAEREFAAYCETKSNARRPTGSHLCPQCNCRFEGGTAARADFVDSPESHSNRAPSHGRAGSIVICDLCKYERFLQQIVLGSKPAELLIVVPRMNIGHASGELLQKSILRLKEQCSWIMSDANPNPNERLSLSNTYKQAQALTQTDLHQLTACDIVKLFTSQLGAEATKKHRKELEQQLTVAYGVDELSSEMLNSYWGTDFTTVETAIDALIKNEITDDDALSARSIAYRLTPQMQIICQTPHLILIPMINPIAFQSDSDVNAAIRSLYVLLILGIALECSVASLNAGEAIAFDSGLGIARVPPVAAIRQLIGSDWLGLNDAIRWLNAITSAALLAPYTAFPERSNLYSTLKSPTVGHILRRIEMRSESGYTSVDHIMLLEKVKEVLQ